ncbi:MAG: hypothetical protein ABIW76_04560 [Fibrobacteria bacterium]
MGFNNLGVKAKLLLGFSGLCALVAFVGIRGIYSDKNLNARTDVLGNENFKNTMIISAGIMVPSAFRHRNADFQSQKRMNECLQRWV